jgi:hypothetical protein
MGSRRPWEQRDQGGGSSGECRNHPDVSAADIRGTGVGLRGIRNSDRSGFMDVRSVQSHRALCTEGDHTWPTALLSPSGKS